LYYFKAFTLLVRYGELRLGHCGFPASQYHLLSIIRPLYKIIKRIKLFNRGFVAISSDLVQCYPLTEELCNILTKLYINKPDNLSHLLCEQRANDMTPLLRGLGQRVAVALRPVSS